MDGGGGDVGGYCVKCRISMNSRQAGKYSTYDEGELTSKWTANGEDRRKERMESIVKGRVEGGDDQSLLSTMEMAPHCSQKAHIVRGPFELEAHATRSFGIWVQFVLSRVNRVSIMNRTDRGERDKGKNETYPWCMKDEGCMSPTGVVGV